jgi:membrane protein YqaA with SNARE-associated domain
MFHHLAHVFFGWFYHFGGWGLLILGIFDSSFLVAPLGNDILVIALSAQRHSVPWMLYYAGMSTIGSVLGVLLVDIVVRPLGEHGLERHLPKKRIDYMRKKVTDEGAWALTLACIAPPPFPFTPFIIAAAALQYPRKRMLAIVAAVRMVRFTALGVTALLVGKQILRWGKSPIFEDFVIALIVIAVVGSVVSVVGWIRRSRKPGSGRQSSQPGPEPATRPAH